MTHPHNGNIKDFNIDPQRNHALAFESLIIVHLRDMLCKDSQQGSRKKKQSQTPETYRMTRSNCSVVVPHLRKVLASLVLIDNGARSICS